MSRLVTLSALTCTRKFCKCPGLLGNTSTVTMNNEVGRSLAVVRWSLQLLRSWLLKLMSSPLSTASSCLQVQPNGMPWWNCRDGWLQRSTRTKVNWPVSMVVYFTQHLVYSWLPTQVWGGMLVGTGSYWICVGRRQPEISRVVLVSSQSIRFEWLDLEHTVLFFSRPRSEGWPHHGRTFSIYLSLLSYWLTLPRGVLMLSIQATTVSARMLNKYGERTQTCRTPFLTRNHSDSELCPV